MLVENCWPRTGAYILFISVISIIVERRIYSVFARLNSWMNGNKIEKREIYLPSTLRSPRENHFLVRQCLVSYRFLSISDTCAWMGWWIVWNENGGRFIRRKECIEGMDDFLVILCLYSEERTIVSSLT